MWIHVVIHKALRLQTSMPIAVHECSCMHGQAVEVRGHAQQQTEQLTHARGGARRQRGAAERAQRAAAALQRSLALSRQVAVMQAQALAIACAAMLVLSRTPPWPLFISLSLSCMQLTSELPTINLCYALHRCNGFGF